MGCAYGAAATEPKAFLGKIWLISFKNKYLKTNLSYQERSAHRMFDQYLCLTIAPQIP
jgi:hypothetical protein